MTDAGETVSAGMAVVRDNTVIGVVTYVDPPTGMLAVETLPTKPRARNWYTAKEWLASGLRAVRTNPPDNNP